MVDNRRSAHRLPVRRVLTVAVACVTLPAAIVVTGADAHAATTPPTFGPQVDIGSGYSQPWGVAVGGGGDTYVADTTANTVWRVPVSGGPMTTVGSGFRVPMAVAVDTQDNVYVADWGNARVVRVSAVGVQTTVVSGLSAPSAVAVDAAGDLFIANSGAGTILEQPVNSSGFTTLASGFGYPTGLAVDAAGGTLYVADSSNAGNSVTRIVLGGNGSTTTLPIAGVQNPNGLALDASGNLFVANPGGNSVLMLTPDGTTSRVGGGYISPEGVAVNPSGDVVVADTFAPRVTVNPSVDPQSITLTKAIAALTAPGTSSTLAATGGGSGRPVVFSLDPSTYPDDACTLGAGGRRVSFAKVGTCVIDVDQAASYRYLAAHRVVTVTIRPTGLTALGVQGPSTPPAVGPQSAFTVRGLDAHGNDLGDVTAITTFAAGNGSCDRASCSWETAGRSTVTARAPGARGTLAVTVALGVYLVSDGAAVASFTATVGTPIDALLYPVGGSSGTYSIARTAGRLPAGVTLGADGTFGGSPTKAGTYQIAVLVKDTGNGLQRATVAVGITVGRAKA